MRLDLNKNIVDGNIFKLSSLQKSSPRVQKIHLEVYIKSWLVQQKDNKSFWQRSKLLQDKSPEETRNGSVSLQTIPARLFPGTQQQLGVGGLAVLPQSHFSLSLSLSPLHSLSVPTVFPTSLSIRSVLLCPYFCGPTPSSGSYSPDLLNKPSWYQECCTALFLRRIPWHGLLVNPLPLPQYYVS